MAPDVTRSRADLELRFEEQIGFLETSARLFDQGQHAEAKRLAVTLRVLFHEKGRSRSLLKQLGFEVVPFYDTAGEILAGNLLTECPLVMMSLGPSATDYLPMLGGGPLPPRSLPFSTWWNQVVFIDRARERFSRRDVVLSVADQDGGAHIDPGLNSGYHALSRDNSLAWVIGSPDGKRPAGNPVPAALRQIAYEALKSMKPVRVKIG